MEKLTVFSAWKSCNIQKHATHNDSISILSYEP